ncbi:hypothetical protein FN846DRAFT_896208 [Sphaerosporella brunnea]|uniref:DUF6589 domain-containing protein n=1 Tax=Sphaerosporella brunnea TaxID=1250544 RepID=A0A5J5ECA0_9PEZI|nr:hypothetical protein FN846DRAFT_896208 [Sphaerosporella brunnea]
MDIDESSIDVTTAVIEKMSKELEIPLSAFRNRVILSTGDQLTTKNIRSAQELRVRDMQEKRMEFVYPIAGCLHILMAIVDGIFRSHSGRSDGRDPTSLTRFAGMLGRSGLGGKGGAKVVDYSACVRFVLHVLDAHILAAMVGMVNLRRNNTEQPRLKSVADLRRWLKCNNWLEMLQEAKEYYGILAKPNWQKTTALNKATETYTSKRQAIMDKKKDERTAWELNFTKTAESKKWIMEELRAERDIVFENFLKFLHHATLLRDAIRAVKTGTTGRLEKNLEMLCVFFHGCSKPMYALEMLELQVDRKCLWTPECQFVYLNNCLQNLSGKSNKYQGNDNIVEHVNAEIKVSYNPRNTGTAQKFLLETVARNLVTFWILDKAVLHTSGAPKYGSKHSTVNARYDITRMADTIISDQSMVRKPGRYSIGVEGNKVEVSEAVDAFALGGENILSGHTLENVLHKRIYRLHLGDVPYDAYENPEAFLDRLESENLFGIHS